MRLAGPLLSLQFNNYSGAAKVALSGISAAFTARAGYMYKVTLKTGNWDGTVGTGTDVIKARFTVTGTNLTSPDPVIVEAQFFATGDGSSYTGDLLLTGLTADTVYTLGIDVQCMLPSASAITFAQLTNSDLQVWVTELETLNY